MNQRTDEEVVRAALPWVTLGSTKGDCGMMYFVADAKGTPISASSYDAKRPWGFLRAADSRVKAYEASLTPASEVSVEAMKAAVELQYSDASYHWNSGVAYVYPYPTARVNEFIGKGVRMQAAIRDAYSKLPKPLAPESSKLPTPIEPQLPPLDVTQEERSYAGATLRKPHGANLRQQLEIAQRHLGNKWGDLLCRERQLLAALSRISELEAELAKRKE